MLCCVEPKSASCSSYRFAMCAEAEDLNKQRLLAVTQRLLLVVCQPFRQRRDTNAPSLLKAAMLKYFARGMQKRSSVPLDLAAAAWKAEDRDSCLVPPREPHGVQRTCLWMRDRRPASTASFIVSLGARCHRGCPAVLVSGELR